MNKKRIMYLTLLSIMILGGCSNSKIETTEDSSSNEPKKEVTKKKVPIQQSDTTEESTVETIEDELTEVKEVVEVQEVTSQEPVTAYSEQAISDMPPSWYGSAEDWEEAKLYGWTAEGYEEQVRASENESGPIQPGDPDYNWPYADEQRNDFFNEFYNEHGREPTSGEIQYAWAQEQGWE